MDNVSSIHHPSMPYHELVQQISLIHLAGFQKYEISDEYNFMKRRRGTWADTNRAGRGYGKRGVALQWGQVQLRMILYSYSVF